MALAEPRSSRRWRLRILQAVLLLCSAWTYPGWGAETDAHPTEISAGIQADIAADFTDLAGNLLIYEGKARQLTIADVAGDAASFTPYQPSHGFRSDAD